MDMMIVVFCLSVACAFLAGVAFSCSLLAWRLRAERNHLLSAIAEDRARKMEFESSESSENDGIYIL